MRYIRGRTKARGDCTRTSLNIQHSQVFFIFSRLLSQLPPWGTSISASLAFYGFDIDADDPII